MLLILDIIAIICTIVSLSLAFKNFYRMRSLHQKINIMQSKINNLHNKIDKLMN